MKKRLFLILLAVVFCLSGCANSNEKKVDYEAVYEDIINEYFLFIKDGFPEYDDGKAGVWEAMEVFGRKALDNIGYVVMDINDDGVCELLIGDNGEDGYVKNNLYAMYTIKDEIPVLVFEGRARNSYSLLEGGKIFNYGSNGAIYRIFGIYELDEAELDCDEFYFSYEKDDNFEDIGFFYNPMGEYDKEVSEELDITDEEFFEKEEDFAKDTKKLEFKMFRTLDEGAPEDDEPEIVGKWITTSETGEGYDFVLFVDILEGGVANYRVGPPESEIMADYNGTWEYDKVLNTITFDMVDKMEGYSFSGCFEVSYDGYILNLTHMEGDSFLYDTNGKTFSFSLNN